MDGFADNFAALGLIIGLGVFAACIVALATSRRIRTLFWD
jgi:hypothetical protein